MRLNVIRSVFGLEHPASWLNNQIKEGKTLVLLDEERANATLYRYGSTATREGGIRSLDGNIPQDGGEVKSKFSLKGEKGRIARLEREF